MPEAALCLPVHDLSGGGKHVTWLDVDLAPLQDTEEGCT